MEEDPYEILDVPKDKDIDFYRDVYREHIKEYHPDLGGSKDQFIKVQKAYEKIKKDCKTDDSTSKNILDKTLNSESKDSSQKDNSKYTYPSKVRYINYNILKQNPNLSEDNIFKNWTEYNYEDMGEFTVTQDKTILESAEENNESWPYSCRGGACSNCAIKIINGNVETKSFHILPEELLEEGYRLSCIGKPLSKEIDIIYNINQHTDIQDYLLPDRS